METTVTVERVADEEEMEDLPSHEILRANLKKRSKGKRVKTHYTELRCHVCGKICYDRGSLTQHVQLHSSSYPFPCRQCDYQAKTKKYLARHMKRVHGPPPTAHVCEHCGKGFHYRTHLLSHERVHTGAKPFKCDVCGKDFRAHYSLVTHKLIHTDEKPFHCSYCDYACRDSSTLRKHQERHLGTIHKYQCDVCQRRYDSLHKLKEHVREVHAEPDARRHQCATCGATFKKRSALNNHNEAVHKRSKTCACPVCGVTLSTYHNLKEHLRRHLSERPYKCAVEACGSSFKDRQSLKKHNRIHDISAQVICDVCGKTFSRKHRLAKHLTHHLPRVKREQCPQCGDKFYTKQYLVKHIRQKHARKRQQYICDMCEFTTHNKPSIVMHIKYGHNLNKGKCKLCGKSYKRNQHLREHYSRMHGLRFKTNARMHVLPEAPEVPVTAEVAAVRVKEEPPELVADLEIDLLDIKKEEPFAGLEASEYPELPVRGRQQSLQQFLARVIHDAADVDIDELHLGDKIVDKATWQDMSPHEQNIQTNRYSQQDVSSEEFAQRHAIIKSVKVVIERRSSIEEVMRKQLAAMNSLKKIMEEENTSIVEDDNLQQKSGDKIVPEYETSSLEESKPLQENLIQEEQIAKDVVNVQRNSADFTHEEEVTKALDNFAEVSRDSHLVEEQSDPSSVVVQVTEETAEVTQSQRRCVPVEEFIQRVIGDVKKEREEDNMIVDTAAEAGVERRLRELLQRAPHAARRTRSLRAPAEAEEMKNKKREEPEELSQRVDDDDEAAGSGDKAQELPAGLRLVLNMQQCYVCFKVFETKPKLIEHCKSHFDVCNERTLKKCPLCPHVTTKDIKKHIKRNHHQDIDISFMNIKDRRDNATGSRYFYNTKNETIKELEIIPSIKILNKKASMDLDKRNRDRKDKFVGKPKLVRKGTEWIVVKEKLDLSNHVLPDSKDLDKTADNYLEVIKKLGMQAKRKGVKMLYPCNKCEKVCQNLSALTLHSRRHDPNPTPFKPRGSTKKNKEIKMKMIENTKVNTDNRCAKPKPIVNNHKCDPKLMDFYEQNIKGGDIEFWQFLKIYNKMNREEVNSFEDLEARTEFGIHYDAGKVDSGINNETELDKDLNINKESVKKKAVVSKKVKRKAKDGRDKDMLIGNRTYNRTIRITKVEYNKRMEIKNKLREKLKEDK